ncbi:MAG: hypothetical protein R8J94_08410 [Acidimicrobiia bacterium]|nr:hypothetical protein [Acidimicrobiia bacterium]
MHKNLKRLTMMGLGSALIAVSVLAGALTSAAAAHDLHGTYELQTESEPDDNVVEFEATNAIRIDERATARFSPNGKFAARTPTLRSGGCDIVFEGDPLLFQPDYARNTFVTEPWREKCSSTWTEVVGSTYQHLHLGFQNEDISLCGSGPLAGQFAMIGDDFSCTDFDPLTEPRSAPYSHSGNEVVEFRMYDADGYQNFRLDRIRVVDNPIRVCVHKAGGGLDTVVMNGGAGSPNATCWNLDEGYWNLSGHDVDAHLVTLTGANGSSSPFSFDDIRITER